MKERPAVRASTGPNGYSLKVGVETAERGTTGGRGLRTLVPLLGMELEGQESAVGPVYRAIEGSLLSADISGFTRLTESLGAMGRQGAEEITRIINSCFADLISAAQSYGGDIIKFGGDAVLVFFRGDQHERRALAAGQEMQGALRQNAQARHHELGMTVGINAGPFDAMVVGSRQRDVLICGANTTATLSLIHI